MRGSSPTEAGFSLVEVMVSALLLVVGLLGAFVALDSSSHLNSTVLRQQVVANEGEKQMETLKSKTYGSLWMSGCPANTTDGILSGDTSGNPANPNYWVTGSGVCSSGTLKIAADFNKESAGTLPGTATTGELFITSGTGTGVTNPGASPPTCILSPLASPCTYSDGGVTGSVYTYLTWVNDPCSGGSGGQDAKRITVAVDPTNVTGGGPSKPVWYSSIVSDGGTTC